MNQKTYGVLEIRETQITTQGMFRIDPAIPFFELFLKVEDREFFLLESNSREMIDDYAKNFKAGIELIGGHVLSENEVAA